MHKQNWDDLRFVIAVAETGSVSQAARRLGVNHATVLRRVAEFEQRHGAVIFEKTTRGYRVLADKRDVILAAKSAETAIKTAEQLAGGRPEKLYGTTRVTSTNTFCQNILPNLVHDLHSQSRNLFIEVINSDAHVDLALHRIDVAIRPAVELSPDLEGETVSELGFAVYARDTSVTGWLGLIGPLARSLGGRWMMENIKADQIVSSADSFLVLHALAATGLGKSILPCIIGDADPRLCRVDVGMPHFVVPIWVASHVNSATSPRVKLLCGALNTALSKMAGDLRG